MDAFEKLALQEPQRAGEIEFDLALGIAANEAGQFTRAIIALERVLAVQPAHERARAEFGRALYGVGDNKAARALLAESQQKGFTSVAGDTIDQLLHAIDRVEAEGRSSAKAYLELNTGWDSNINSAPGLSSVAVPAFGGAILAVDPSGTRRSGGYLGWTAGASGRMVLGPRWSLIGTALARGTSFGDGNRVSNNAQADINVGVSYRVEREEYSLAVQGGTYTVGGSRARDNLGLVGEWTYRFDGFRQFNAYFQTSRLVYPAQHVADANRNVVGFTYAHLTAKGMWTYGGAYVGAETVDDGSAQHLGHHLVGVRGGLQYPLFASVGAFASGGYERRRYGAPDPLFNVYRVDQQVNLALGLSWVPAPYWRVTPQLSWVKTDSSVPLGQYSKKAYAIAVRREF